MKKIVSLILALVLLFLCGCTNTTNEEIQNTQISASEENTSSKVEDTKVNDGPFKFTRENYPRMGGSLANLPLAQAVTATVLGTTREDANNLVKLEGSTTSNYEALCDGYFDILLAYEPSEEAKWYMKKTNVELEMTPIGVDALIFITSKQNKVNNLTVDQIKSIYSGETTNWKDVGGSYSKITAYQRNKDSGSQTLFDKLINLGDKLIEAPKDQRIDSMLGLLEAISDYDDSKKGALGYTVYYYLTAMNKDKLETSKILSVNGVEPSNETISDGSYPLTNDFYVVIRKDAAENSPERILYNWICSAQGRELVEKENYPVRAK